MLFCLVLLSHEGAGTCAPRKYNLCHLRLKALLPTIIPERLGDRNTSCTSWLNHTKAVASQDAAELIAGLSNSIALHIYLTRISLAIAQHNSAFVC